MWDLKMRRRWGIWMGQSRGDCGGRRGESEGSRDARVIEGAMRGKLT